jgi:hypothetical protein
MGDEFARVDAGQLDQSLQDSTHPESIDQHRVIVQRCVLQRLHLAGCAGEGQAPLVME